MKPQIFFQSSMPRAGSTLLQNIIAQNPGFYVTPSSGLLELIYGARVSYTKAPEFQDLDPAWAKRAFLAFSRSGMEAYFRALTERPYVLDKSRGWGIHFDLLSLILEDEPKIVCMVRDLKQILSSMEKRFRLRPEKVGVTEGQPISSPASTLKRMLSNLQTPPIGQALDRMVEIQQRGWNQKMLFIRFEDLTTQPQVALRKVYHYFGLPEFAHDFRHVAQVTHEDDRVFDHPGLHDIRPEVSPPPDDAQEILGREGIQYLQSHYAWYARLFGY